MGPEDLLARATGSLEDMKGQDLRVLDVRGITSIADYMIVVSGTSDRHVRSLADRLVSDLKELGERPAGVEGQSGGEWILVDLGDVIVHVMQRRVRDFFNLEKLWDRRRDQDAGAPLEAER